MKTSREWLQTYFEKPLPDAATLAEALTFHAFEIESVEGDILDVKVTPNRGHDCLSHRGVVKELSAILDLPIKADSLRHPAPLEPKTEAVRVTIENPELCRRFTGAYIKGVRVGPSPEWLRVRLEAIGQRSINNVVDATNFVMLDMGQPLHAFDAGKLTHKDGAYSLNVRAAKNGEKMLGLDDKEDELAQSMLVIADGHTGEAVSIAGVKGGKPTGIDETTTEIILEAANWDGTNIRKTSQALKLRTDASDRFQQVISPELAAYGLKAATELILELASGEVAGFIDEYPRPQATNEVTLPPARANDVLGTTLSAPVIEDVFRRLDLSHMQEGDTFTINPAFERLDLVIPEDLVEEVARVVANKVDGVRPYLRATLVDGLRDALERNARNKDLLGLKEVRIFEIGTVWKDGIERIMLGTADSGGVKEISLEPIEASTYDDLPISTTDRYHSFSKYPFIVRDIALWTPAGTEPETVLSIIRAQAGQLLVRSELFDRFEKGEKTSLAFRLVFQSFEKTLTDEEVKAVMEKVNE